MGKILQNGCPRQASGIYSQPAVGRPCIYVLPPPSGGSIVDTKIMAGGHCLSLRELRLDEGVMLVGMPVRLRRYGAPGVEIYVINVEGGRIYTANVANASEQRYHEALAVVVARLKETGQVICTRIPVPNCILPYIVWSEDRTWSVYLNHLGHRTIRTEIDHSVEKERSTVVSLDAMNSVRIEARRNEADNKALEITFTPNQKEGKWTRRNSPLLGIPFKPLGGDLNISLIPGPFMRYSNCLQFVVSGWRQARIQEFIPTRGLHDWVRPGDARISDLMPGEFPEDLKELLEESFYPFY